MCVRVVDTITPYNSSISLSCLSCPHHPNLARHRSCLPKITFVCQYVSKIFYSTSHALVTLYIYSIFNNYIFYSPLIVPSASKSMKTSSTSLSAAPDFKGSGSVSSLAVPPPPQASGTPLNRSPLANLRTTVGAHCCPWDPLGHLEDQEPSGV
jgi:hypothetical protein